MPQHPQEPPQPSPHIGTLAEKSLHAAVKLWYQQQGDAVEQGLDGFVIDMIRGARLIENSNA